MPVTYGAEKYKFFTWFPPFNVQKNFRERFYEENVREYKMHMGIGGQRSPACAGVTLNNSI